MNLNFRKIIYHPWTHIIFLMLLLLILVLVSNITVFDDGIIYQKFIEKTAAGQIDLSIPGFHGADFLAVPIFWLTHSQLSPYIIDIILAFFSIPIFYLLGKEIFQNKQAGVFLAYAYILMPLEYLNMFRGGHQTAFIFFFVLGLYLLVKGNFWSWLSLGVSYIIKPYAIFAAPFFIYKKKYKEFLLSLIIPAIYVFFQIQQIGKVTIGVHQDIQVSSFFGIKNSIMNFIYALQNLLSVHNYSPFSNVYHTDMSHITVILVVLGLMAIFQHKAYFKDRRLFLVIASSTLLGLVGASVLEYIDMWRLIVFYIMAIILALPVLEKYKFFIPLTIGVSGFQFLYSYLAYQSTFWPSGNKFIFIIWILVLLISIIYFITANRNLNFRK